MRLTEEEAAKLGVKPEKKILSKRNAKNKALLSQVARGAEPQEILTQACLKKWGDLCVPELKNTVPNRKYSLDIGFPRELLAVELDGWAWHGRFLNDFKRDRERQNLLTLNGWHILRFTASDVKNQLEHCLLQIETCLSNIEAKKNHHPKKSSGQK